MPLEAARPSTLLARNALCVFLVQTTMCIRHVHTVVPNMRKIYASRLASFFEKGISQNL
jgi:hypothetical protein